MKSLNRMQTTQDEITVTVESELLQITANGKGDFAWAEKFWTMVSAEFERAARRNVLAVLYTTEPLNTMEAFDLAILLQRLSIKSQCQIAWVELNPDVYEAALFSETILVNRFFPIRLFDNVTGAREWLFRE